MTTRTNGVGTPRDSITPMKKEKFGKITKFNTEKIDFNKNQVHGEYMTKYPSGRIDRNELIDKLDQLLKAGTITQKEYDKIKAQIQKEF